MCSRVIKVAKEFSDVTFAVSNKRDYDRGLEDLGLEKSDDVVVGLYDSKGKYAMTEKFRWAWRKVRYGPLSAI